MFNQLYASSSTNTLCAFALAAAAAVTLNSGHALSAAGTGSMLVPGDSIVTGFSGNVSSSEDRFIDLDGPSAQVLSLRDFAHAPRGTLSDPAIKHRVTAAQVGQVFAIALDDGQDRAAPDIYLGSTSYFGLEIVVPDRNGDGKADRVRIGQPDARWMAGQFGPDGNPGSIWRVNGTTGEVTPFATLPNNTGAGIGDIVFDKAQRQFFVSDLETGLIYRIDMDGQVIDSFNHGTDGRSAAGLAAIEDDGRTADIRSSAFNGADPATWGQTQKHRRVAGMAHYQGRLYYAVADGPQIWSVGVGEDGSFTSDARLELTVSDLPGTGPVTDMLFDRSGRLYLAQRGEQRATDVPSRFAEPAASAVVRYSRTDSAGSNGAPVWTRDEDGYAIGKSGAHNQSNGGIALGFQHSQTGALQPGTPDATLWVTGDRLLQSGASQDAASAREQADVHGLQGNDVSLLRPQNTPPSQSYFVDYDGKLGDPDKSGHLGDVEIWQSGDAQVPSASEDLLAAPGAEDWPIAGFTPPGDSVPPDVPTEFPPPQIEFNANLKLTKRAVFKKCKAVADGWRCRYRIRIRNTGPDTYAGPIRISERLVNPGGATLSFGSLWNCWTVGAANYHCRRPNVVLPTGASISLTAVAKVPSSFARCRLKNVAKILRAPGGSRWNTNPLDDGGMAVAKVPGDDCKTPDDPPPKRTNLSLKKKVLSCNHDQNNILCSFQVTVKNSGLNAYNAPLVVRDVPMAGANSVQFSGSPWNCGSGVGNGYRCEYDTANLAPGDDVSFLTWMRIPKQIVRNNNCRVENRAHILRAPGGSRRNTNPADDGSKAVAQIPQDMCGQDPEKQPLPLTSNLKIEKTAGESCERTDSNRWCVNWQVKVTNTGPASFNDVIRFRELFPANAQLTPLSQGLSCTGGLCQTSAPVALGAGSVKSFYVTLSGSVATARLLKCKVTNRVEIVAPATVPSKNTDKSDDKAQATATLAPKLCEQNPLDHTPAPGPGKVKPPSDNCKPGFSPVHGRCLPEVSSCPRGLKKVSASRVRNLRHKGWTVRRVPQAGRALWCGKPGKKQVLKCRKTWKKVASRRAIPKGWKSYRVARSGAVIWCAKKVREKVTKCRRPARWNGKRCVTPKAHFSRKCKKGYVGHKPNCRKIVTHKRKQRRIRSRRDRK